MGQQSFLTSINGVSMHELGAQGFISDETPPLEWSHAINAVAGGPASYGSSSFDGIALSLHIVPEPGGSGLNRSLLKAALRPEGGEWVLGFWKTDDIEVHATVVTTSILDDGFSDVWVRVTALDPYVQAAEATTFTSPTLEDSVASISFPVENPGNADSEPVLRIRWDGTFSGTFKHHYRRLCTVTNNSEETLFNHPVFAFFGDRTEDFPANDTLSSANTVAAGKARPDGNDVRVWYKGRQIPRTLINWNTHYSFVQWNVPLLPPGESAEFEVVYGATGLTAPTQTTNSIGGTSYERFCALDLSGDSGTATSGGTSTLTDSGKSWRVNRWVGATVMIIGGTGAKQVRRVASNTATQLTVTRAWVTNPDSTSVYVVWRSGCGGDGGVHSNGTATVTTLVDNSQSWLTNEWVGCELYIHNGTGTGEFRTITSNTATTLNFSGSMSIGTSSQYRILGRNQMWVYNVPQSSPAKLNNDETATGGWFQNSKYSKPSIVRFDNAGGWRRFTYLANDDVYNQSRAYPLDVGGGDIDYFNGFDADRRRANSGTLAEAGQADGVTISVPVGVRAIRAGGLFKNPEGICKYLILARAAGGDDWESLLEYTTGHTNLTTIATANYYPSQTARHVAFAVAPADEDAGKITPEAAANSVATARWGNCLELRLDATAITVTDLDTEEEIYDCRATIRVGGGSNREPPYDQIRIGWSDPTTTGGVFFTADQELVIDCANKEATIREVASGDLVRRVPWAVSVERHEERDGEDVAWTAARWLPIPPGANLEPNPSADSDASGWEITGTTSGVTVDAITRSTVDFHTAPAAFDTGISANTAGATGQQFIARSTTFVRATEGRRYGLSMAVNTSDADLVPRIGFRWFDKNQSAIGSTNEGNWTPTANTWHVRTLEVEAPAGAHYAKAQWFCNATLANQTGNMAWDSVYVGTPIVYLDDFSANQHPDVTLIVEVKPAWLVR